MLTLYRTGRYETLGDVSPFVYKLETWLRMAGVPYESQIISTRRALKIAPRNLIPFVDLDGERVGDSSLIINRLIKLHGDPLKDSRLSVEQRNLGELIKTLCEHEMFYIQIYGRWEDADWETFARFIIQSEGIPKFLFSILKGQLRKLSKNMLHGYRLGRFDHEHVRRLLNEKLAQVDSYLGTKPFLFGDEPSTYDAGLYSTLASFVHFPIDNPHVEIARSHEGIVQYCDRIRKAYFPADVWKDR